MNEIIDFWMLHMVAIVSVLAFCAVVGLLAIARLWRVLYVFLTSAGVLVAVFAALQLTSVRIHPFDLSWDVDNEIALDANIARMAKRARFDFYVCGIPPIGRGKLRLDSAARHGSDFDLFFTPIGVSHTLVVYRFASDGKALWKTCNWVKT